MLEGWYQGMQQISAACCVSEGDTAGTCDKRLDDGYLAGVVEGCSKSICNIVRSLQQQQTDIESWASTMMNTLLLYVMPAEQAITAAALPAAQAVPHLLDSCHIGVGCQLHISDVDKQ